MKYSDYISQGMTKEVYDDSGIKKLNPDDRSDAIKRRLKKYSIQPYKPPKELRRR